MLISWPFDFPPFSLGFTKRRRRRSGVAVEAIDRPRAPLARVVARHPCERGWRDRAQDPLAAGGGEGVHPTAFPAPEPEMKPSGPRLAGKSRVFAGPALAVPLLGFRVRAEMA